MYDADHYDTFNSLQINGHHIASELGDLSYEGILNRRELWALTIFSIPFYALKLGISF
jgi:hypothetical protein